MILTNTKGNGCAYVRKLVRACVRKCACVDRWVGMNNRERERERVFERGKIKRRASSVVLDPRKETNQ